MKKLTIIAGVILSISLVMLFISRPRTYIPNDHLINMLQEGKVDTNDSIEIIPVDLKKDTMMGDVVHVDNSNFVFTFEETTRIEYIEKMKSKYVSSKNVMGIWIVTLKGGE